jgi:hypothetical protein
VPGAQEPAASNAHAPFFRLEKVCHVRNRDTALKKDSRERMPERVGRWPFLEPAGRFEHLTDFSTPHVCDRFELVRQTHDKRTHTATFCTVIEPVSEPVWDIGEYLSAILLRATINNPASDSDNP